ncbi:MAG: serine hydrolase domain-containing protein, partial [Myxococcota bacterium]|nr:serine hydrolase domain-containing protein [Myxococcota bacterium]
MRRSAIARKLERVDRALDKAIDGAEMPGAVVRAAIRRDGEWLEHVSVRGLAVVRPERIPMDRATVFDLASLTKVLATTSAVMLLVEEGRL